MTQSAHQSTSQRGKQRRSIRLQGYDYSSPGWYVLTICTEGRKLLFGEIQNDSLLTNTYGGIAYACWNMLPAHFPNLLLDCFVLMPNHIHGIVCLLDNVGAQHAAPLPNHHHAVPSGNRGKENLAGKDVSNTKKGVTDSLKPGSLPVVVRSYKSAVTRQINRIRNAPGISVWQRNYHERIIRSDQELFSFRRYIVENPINWDKDKYHPVFEK